MHTKVLRMSQSLSDKDPRLRKTVDGAQETGHQRKALHVRDLYARVRDIAQDEGTLVIDHAHPAVVLAFAFQTRILDKLRRTGEDRENERDQCRFLPRQVNVERVVHDIRVLAHERRFVHDRAQEVEPIEVSVDLYSASASASDQSKPR